MEIEHRTALNYLEATEGDIGYAAQQSDRELLEALARGSSAALCHLVENYQAFLLSHCRRIARGNLHDAKDLYGLVMLKLCTEQPEQIRKIRNFGGWLCQVARNQYIDQHRSHQAEERRNDSLIHLYEITNLRQFSPEEEVLNGELLGKIETALHALPPRLRTIAELRFVEEASYEIISDRLGISLLNARKRVQEARHLMTSALLNYVSAGEFRRKSDVRRTH